MINSLHLQNVRSFAKTNLGFTPGVNLIIGSNGSGKTTVLESIGLLAFGKYLSAIQDQFVIRKGEPACRIEFELSEGSKIEIGLSQKEKIIRRNDLPIPVSTLIGLEPQVFFNPETVELVFDSPALRRRELDMVLTQADRGFVGEILAFRNILKQRNALLRSVSSRSATVAELEFWNERFCKSAELIYRARVKLVNFLNGEIGTIFNFLRERPGELQLRYLPSGHYDRFEEYLLARQDSDIENGLTSIGPHRDDFAFLVDHHSMREGASRGEQRLAAVAFKAASSRYLIQEGIRPIIILDDVFSELDRSRQEAVAKVLGLFDADQVFVSATDEDDLPQELLDKSNIIRL